jgi:dTDP-4-dehydrorhamnose reductase
MSGGLRIVVTGTKGQVVSALRERGAAVGIDIVTIGRPDIDFLDPHRVAVIVAGVEGDAIVNAAAYTSVDSAESEPDIAMAVNAEAAGAVARAAARRGIPIIQLSTDFVFDGGLGRPYREDDPVGPTSAYGRSKFAGEQAVVANNPAHVLLRSAWVYSPFGANFVKTMLRLGKTRDLVRVVADQRGNPTSAFNIADAVIAVVRNLKAQPERRDLFGLFHLVDGGEASRADFAEAIFSEAARLGLPAVRVERIKTSDFPTPACRPLDSRLDASRFARIHGVIMPDWRDSVARVVRMLVKSFNI